MTSIIQTLDELLTQKVQEAAKNMLNDIVRKIEQQQKEISELKEENRIFSSLLKSSGLKLQSVSRTRTSAYDIRNLRCKLGISQEVFAFLLGVNKRTIIRWEKGVCSPSLRQRKLLIDLKSMDKERLDTKIKAAFQTLYH